MKTLSLILSAAVLLVTAACSKNVKESATAPDGSKVTLEKKGDQTTMEIKSKSGDKISLNVSEKGMKLATELPKDVPLFPKAVVQMDNSVSGTRMLGTNIPATVDEGVKFYTEEMKKQGWTIDASMAMGEGFMITTKKGERNCTIMITKNGKDTYLQLTLSGKD